LLCGFGGAMILNNFGKSRGNRCLNEAGPESR
jgi:hypothetical protein